MYRLLIVFATLLVCEFSCFGVIWIRTGEPIFWTGWIERQNKLIQQYSTEDEIAAPEGQEGHTFPDETGGMRRDMIHPYLGYVCDPTKTRFANRFGFRGPNPLQQRSDDKLIVAILGGSVAESFSWDGMPTVERELKTDPQFGDKEFLVVHLANGSYKQPQQLFTLNFMLSLGAQFDIVINLDGFNEVAVHEFWIRDAGIWIYPAYPYLWDVFVQSYTDSTTRRLLGRKAFLKAQVVSLARSSLQAPLCYSVTWNAFTTIRQERLIQSCFDTELELRDYLSRIDNHDRYFLTGPKVDMGDEERYAFVAAVWRRCSIQLDRLCRGNDIRYFHFLQPNQYVAGSKPLGPAERARAYKEDAIFKPGVEKGYPRLIKEGKTLSQSGVRFSDLTKVFVDIEDPIYIDDCCHMDLNGNKIVAAAVARAILDDYHSNP